MAYRRRPSLLGALIWIGLGILFLLRNFGIGPDLLPFIGRYWPVLLIILGLGKVIDFFLKKDAVSIRFGEIVGIIFLLLIGSALTKISDGRFGHLVRELPIQIGDRSIRPGQWFGETHAFSEESTYPLPRPLPILIENSYGSVSITPGSDREIRVRLKKVVYERESRAKDIASEIRLEAKPERRGALAAEPKPEAAPGKISDTEYFVIRTNREDLSSKDYTFNTNLEISIPKNSQLQVKNSFGEVIVSGINGDLDLSTTHRNLDVQDCTGQFKISTRYAESRLTNLIGNLNLDARGKIYIENIKGDITITDEYAPMEIFGIEGAVKVSNTEGSIRIEKATKHVTITSRGSEVNLENLQGGLTINASHRNINISNVSSDVAIETRYAEVSLKNIKGSIDIHSTADRVDADGIGGAFKFRGTGSRILASRIDGPLDIESTLKDVVVNDYTDSCTITNEYADITVSSRILGKGEMNLKNSNGDVELSLPESASFLMDAVARNGRVESNYAGLQPVKSTEGEILKSKVKSGGPKISVETKNGTIRIHPHNGSDAN